ncbi:MAG: tetratricopeptide repeat protein [Pseudomonadota bacterium]
MGDYDGASESLERAMRLSPRGPGRSFWFAGKGIVAYIAERHEDVVENAQVMLRVNPIFASAHRQVAASLAMLGRDEKARAAMARLRQLMPDLTLSRVTKMIPVKDPAAEARWLEGLRRAGLPD